MERCGQSRSVAVRACKIDRLFGITLRPILAGRASQASVELDFGALGRPADRFHTGCSRLVPLDFRRAHAAQAQGWPAIAAGRAHAHLRADRIGKTLAAFLWCLDRLMSEPRARGSAAPAARALRLAAEGARP